MSKHPERPRASKRAPTKRISAGGSRRTPPPSKAPNIAAQQKVASFSQSDATPPANAGRQERAKKKGLTLPTLSEGAQMFKDIFFGK